MSADIIAQNQVPNAGFETWDLYNTWTLEPEFWTTPNNQLIESVVPDSNAFEGDLAMKVKVLPGFEGGVPQQASVLFTVNENPSMLEFAVKAMIAGESEQDVVWVKFQGFKEDAQIDGDLYWSTDVSINEWELIQLEIPEFSESIDECLITIQAGETNGLAGGSWDNWISVDAFAIDFSNDIHEITKESKLYPNPLRGNWLFSPHFSESNQTSIDFYSIDGQLLFSKMITDNAIYIDLPPSLYVVVINSKNELRHELLIIE